MGRVLPRLIARQLRRVPASLCMLALAMQVLLPALHAPDAGFVPSGVQAASAPGLHATACAHTDPARHDAATCPQCRLYSQLRTLSVLGTLAVLPTSSSAWIAHVRGPEALSVDPTGGGSPRAPPLPA